MLGEVRPLQCECSGEQRYSCPSLKELMPACRCGSRWRAGEGSRAPRAVLGRRGERPMSFSFPRVSRLLQCAEPVSLYPHLTSLSPPPVLNTWQTHTQKCQLKYAEGSGGHLVGGQDGGEEAPGRHERLWENWLLPFTPRKNADSKQARQHHPPTIPVEGDGTLLFWAFETPRWLEFWPLSKPQIYCFHRSY